MEKTDPYYKPWATFWRTYRLGFGFWKAVVQAIWAGMTYGWR